VFKKSLIVAASASLAAFTMAGTVMAGLPGLDKLKPASSSSSSTTAGTDAVALQDGLVKNYLAANRDLTAGLAEFAEAYGLKDDAAKLKASADTLAGGSVQDEKALDANAKVSAEIQQKVQAQMASGAMLTDEGKKHFIAGLSPYAKGVSGTAAIPKDLQAFSDAAKSQIGAANMMEKAKVTKQLSTGMWLAKQLPGHSANLVKGLQEIVGYAQKNSIPVPADVKSATAAL
jgi:hypothetical protein